MSKSMKRIWRRVRSKSTHPQEKSKACHGSGFRREQWRMSSLVQVAIHASQFPENVRRDLLESLRTRQVNHKFHYDSVKQTQKWLALHQALSPSRTDADCAATYDRGFAEAAARVQAARVHLIGLGCGGGQKDARLLKLLQTSGGTLFYTPSDVSAAMVLVARQTARAVIPEEACFPLVCDLASAEDLPAALDALHVPEAARLITFFGMIPNFEPQVILPRLAALVRPADYLLFSANLAPGPDYGAGMQSILPLYDNALTRDWLMTFLLDLGAETSDGELRFVVEDDPGGSGLKRVAAYFRFLRSREIRVDGQRFLFSAGEAIRLFFSWRHTPALVRTLLSPHGLRVAAQWITKSEEEGVFLVCRS
jgi:L-histidine Nalpha-methyltransferase